MPALADHRSVLDAGRFPSLQAAVTAAVGYNATLMMRPGATYSVDATVTATGTCRIVGNGASVDGTSISSGPVFSVTGDDVVIEGLRVTADPDKSAVEFSEADRVMIRDCVIPACWKGITFTNCNDVRAERNHITITATSGSAGHGLLFAKSGASAPSGFVFSGNRVINTTQPYGHGIWWYGGDADTDTTPQVSRGVIDANHVSNVMGGIWGSLGQFITVSDNVIDTCDDVGIDLERCLDVIVTGNTMRNVKGGALAVLWTSKRIQFTGNHVFSDRTGLVGGGAFAETSSLVALIKHDCEDIEVVGNLFASSQPNVCGEVNMFKSTLNGAKRVTFRANRFHNIRFNGIGGQSGVTLEQNSFYQDWDINGSLVFLRQIGNVVIRGNDFTASADSAASGDQKAVIWVTQNNAATTPRVENLLIERNRIVGWPSTGIAVNTYNGTNATTYVVRDNLCGVVYFRTTGDPASAVRSGNLKPTDNSASTVTGV